MTKAHSDFLNHGHKLARSCWDAWFTAFQYATETNSELIPLIDKGCDYAEQQKPIPKKYLDAGQKLFKIAINNTK